MFSRFSLCGISSATSTWKSQLLPTRQMACAFARQQLGQTRIVGGAASRALGHAEGGEARAGRAAADRRRNSCRSDWHPASRLRHSRCRANPARARWCACPRRKNRRLASARRRAASCRRDRRVLWMRSSLHLPRGARGTVLQHDALGRELVADAIGFFEVLRFARVVAGGDRAPDLFGIDRHSRCDAFLHAGETQETQTSGQIQRLGLVQLRDDKRRVEVIRQGGQKCFADTRCGNRFGDAVPAFQSRQHFPSSPARSNPSVAGSGSSAC